MTTTAWAHLPNSKHIDRVLASLKAHPEKWDAAWDAARDAAWSAAWDAAWSAAWDAAWGAARGAAWGAAWSAPWSAAWSAIAALIAWDDCAYMLELPDDTLSELREAGNKQALLLSTAAKILRETS